MKHRVEALSGAFERRNAALQAKTHAVLARIAAQPVLHARFLNTLAMLEHIGSHKIMATRHGPAIDLPTLKHLAEEARHAFFFKRHAEREAGRPLGGGAEDLLSARAGQRYFGRLEAAVVRLFAAGTPAYLVMSMAVEFRAVWGYGLYQGVLTAAGHGLSLKSLLAEEAGHLDEMAERLDRLGLFDLMHLQTVMAAEQALYEQLLAALERAAAPARQLQDAI